MSGAERALVVLALAAASAGCRPDAAQRAVPATKPVTFTQHVAPIVFARCAPCHAPRGSAPFPLLSYEEVRQRARTIVDVTRRRYMPPWLPTTGGVEFVGDRHLADSEIATLREWVDQGTLKGPPDALPPVPQLADGWQLGAPDLVAKLPNPYTLAASGGDVWRNFVLDVPIDTVRHVKTVAIRPGNTSVVHHALLGIDATRASRRRDAATKEPGFGGMDMGDAAAPEGHLFGWTPGMSAFGGVPGQAWTLQPNTDLVLQLHLVPSGRPELVDPAVGIYFAEPPSSGASLALLRLDADHMLDIPAGASQFIATDYVDLPVAVEVLAVYPHAHLLGKQVNARAVLPDGRERPLLRIEHWDIKWQDIYRFRQPVALPRGSRIAMEWVFDNSAANVRNPHRPPQRVTAGLQTSDEMAHLQMQVMASRPEHVPLLRAAMYRRAIAKTPNDAWAYYELGNALRDLDDSGGAIAQYERALQRDPNHAVAHNNLGVALAEQGDVDRATAHYRAALRSEPDLADARFNLGNALRTRGDLTAAAAQYRDALRLEPHFAAASNNLGEVLASQGRLEDAIAEFRRAVRLNPASAQAHNNLGAANARSGRLDEAIRDFEEALRHDPGHAGARDNLRLARDAAASATARRR